MRVLVVEDEARLSQQIVRALGEAGYAVDAAADGARADFLAQTERYDAVVLDLGLPRVDGLTLVRRWRAAGLARASTAAPTITWPSRSASKSCWRVCGR
jgi:two-component system OmpR family response regulator